jgi:predicted DsbA family dithiol-disulfide isomerase
VIVRLDVWTDFTCPHCFFAALIVKKLERECALDVHWRSFQLRQPGSPSISESTRETMETERQEIAKLARDEFGVALKPGPVGMNTRLPHIESHFAEIAEKGDAFHSAVMAAYWLEGRAIDTPEAVQEIAVGVGLDPNAAMFALTNLKLSQRVDADRYEAEGRGLHAIPAFVFNHNYVDPAAQSYNALLQIIEKLSSGDMAAGAGK